MPTLNETQDRTQKALDAFMRLSKAPQRSLSVYLASQRKNALHHHDSN